MTRHHFHNETLMAFADGELDAATAKAVERAMETDDDLVTRVGLFIETRARAKEALAPMLDAPVPEALRNSLDRLIAEAREREGGSPAVENVVPLRRPANDPGRFSGSRWIMPLAASLVAAIAAAAGYSLGVSENQPSDGLAIAGLGDAALPEALARTPSGDEIALGEASRFRAIATFEDSEGALCREFEVDSPGRSTVVSVACRNEAGWRMTFAVVAAGGDDGYAPASSLDALDSYLEAIGAGEPMSADDEAEALAGNLD